MPKAPKRVKSTGKGHSGTTLSPSGSFVRARQSDGHRRALQSLVRAADDHGRRPDNDDVRPRRRRPKGKQPTQEANMFKTPLSVYTGKGTWKSYEPNSTSSASIGATTTIPWTSLRLVTYNTWSSSPNYSQAQSRALLMVLESSQADVISLQEVSHPLQTQLRSADWVRKHYLLTRLEDFWFVSRKGGSVQVQKLRGVGKKEGTREGVLMLVRKGLLEQRGWEAQVEYISMQRNQDEKDKAIILLRMMDSEGGEQSCLVQWRIATSHYSSLPTCDQIRQHQYRQTLRLLQQKPTQRSSAILGDFNANSELEFAPFLASKWVDSHLLARCLSEPPDFREGSTFGHLYPFVPGQRDGKPRKPRRIDRIYLGGEAKALAMSADGRMGTDPIFGDNGCKLKDVNGDEMFPSDHEGVWVELELGR
ncbi:hypothetical protein MVLG_01534 [Microbotryum lychnidis-dioicae p1A1 Lamole]|uniref:Endonuclease/exonuclease/phosphatase domain-containing protein n=1 Tax=Microbotryum lychnidis-dioicae (strain p1A1 Lamole / MvSl-1064) TaxID=683840 RepID=U5H2E5_USTV1|nr:hypothetical protein MVLG_01534 [Microbotryum lychnidis-dioicae p1A1 Lamole]|eukprot:KDE08268.1 hypothetical protein MVLG_01534 [Microbotryum lychnidis-dioicae p1A1 Lamole]